MNIDLIRAAAARPKGRAGETPPLSSPFLDQIAGRRVLVKAECLQHTGSFKYRGGGAAVSAPNPAPRGGGKGGIVQLAVLAGPARPQTRGRGSPPTPARSGQRWCFPPAAATAGTPSAQAWPRRGA